jgi:nucleotide-binding universal stress UspA family protein
MFSKVLIATDLSQASGELVQCMGSMKKLGVEETVLFHSLRIKYLDYMKYQFARDAEPMLQKQVSVLQSKGFKTKIEIASGEPAYEINNYCTNNDISLVVIGTHGKSLLQHALLGGEATKILQQHKCPLLVVRMIRVKGKDEVKCKKDFIDNSKGLLYATDFSDTAQRAFTFVEGITEKGWKKVTLLHVQDSSRIEKHLKDRLQEFNKIDTGRLEMLKEVLVKKGIKKVDIKILYGLPFKEIINIANSGSYSLTILGSQGRGFAGELFLGSVSHNIVRNSDIPVLLIPAIR